MEEALRLLSEIPEAISCEMVTEIISQESGETALQDVFVAMPDLYQYDLLLKGSGCRLKTKDDAKELLCCQLKGLRLPAIRECFREEAQRARAENLSYEEYLGELVRLEWESRREHRVERMLRESRLPLSKNLASFDMTRLPQGVRTQVRVLLEGEFVNRGENVLAFGSVGSGKTHLLSAIGQELVYSGVRIISFKCQELMQELVSAKRRLEIAKKSKKLRSFEVLVIDDIEYANYEREEMEALFSLISDRYERKSIMLSSNPPFYGWE